MAAECFNIYIEDVKGQIENLALLHILKGDTGNSIDKIELTNTSENGLEKTYRITFTDKTTFDYIVKDGNGIVDIEYLSTSLDGLQKTYQINFQDSTSFQFVINQGIGIKTIEKTSTLGLVDTYTITFADNSTTTFHVKNGNGIESIAKTNTNVLVDTYTITFTDTTTTTFDVTNAKSITNIEFVSSDLLTDTYKINFNDNSNILFYVANGRGINNVSYISTNGLVDTYRITYNDNTTSDFIVTNGQGYTEKGLWVGTTTYNPYDVVYSDNGVFASKTTNTNSEPTISNTTNWDCWVDISAILGQQKVLIKAQGNIAKGDCLQYVSSLGDRLICKKAVGSEIKVQSKLFMGIASEDILNNQSGYLQTFGLLRNINTSIYNLGDVLYFDYATSTLSPTRPIDESTYLINVLAVTNVSIGNGSVFVRPTWENIVDSVFSKTSTNPIRNSILTNAINSLNLTASIPLSAGQYYTLTTAIAAVPSALRKIGFVITFESSAGVWETYQFKGVIANWSVLGSWSNDLSLKIDKTAVSLYNITNEIPLPAGQYYTLTTAIAAIPTNIRKLGLKITFQISATNTETWEFFNGTIWNITNVAYWRKTANSADLDLKIDKSSIADQLGVNKDKVMSQYGVSDAIMKSYLYDRNQLAYGVRLDLGGVGKPLERVGNLSLHTTRPISSNARNCVKNVQGVNYYLSSASDYYKEDGITPSVLDGTDGDVMKEIPEFYVLEETVNNYAYTWLSEFPLAGFKRIPRTYHGLYEGSYDTTTNQLRSVINSNIRGGLPATGSARLYYNNGAKQNRNTTWSIDRILSNYVRELLFRVDYASYDCQAAYNSQLTAEGYLQGGLGDGVTTLDGRWEFNDYNPFIPCGYTAELGNRTGVKDFTMPYAYEAQNTTTHVNWYKGIYNASTIYNIGEYVADKEDTSIGLGDGKLYKCIQQTTAGIPLTNITYFTLQTRTVVQANRYLVEVPFGHTYKHTIDALIELSENYTVAKCYIYDNPEHFADTKTANARFLCNMPAIDGYIKTFNKYTTITSSIGGSSASWGYDYFYIKNDSAGILRGLVVGGSAYNGAFAGFGCSTSNGSPAHASTAIGVRLCCIEENIIL